MQKKIAITGMGVITANANNLIQFAEALRTGRSGIKKITLFDSAPYACQYMGEIEKCNSPDTGLDRASQLALLAARSAIVDAGKEWIYENRERTGVLLGTTCGGVTSHETIMRAWRAGHEVLLSLYDEVPFHAMAEHIAQEHELEGPVATITIACASGTNAVGFAADLIRSGQAALMLAGGSDTVSNFTFSGFSILRAMAHDMCQPFDKDRTGVSLGEGAGFLVLEEEDHARRRGARIYAEILGHGFCNDAYHSTAPDPMGSGMVRSVMQALHKASLRPEDIDYVNAHGTGTRANDEMEFNAYKAVFGDRVRSLPISSTKSMVGHTLGAAGAVELIATVLALNGQFVPPTIRLNTPDPLCTFDAVQNESRPAKLRRAICCNAGFAGHNAAVIVGESINSSGNS